jgi:hypothetical protein
MTRFWTHENYIPPNEIIDEHDLKCSATDDGWIYMEIRKGMLT